jgi:glycosyltransferase involved in cell wall biosynthesis
VYRGAQTLPELCVRLDAVFTSLEASYEIILVNDDSPDNSWEVMQKLRAQNSQVKIVRLLRNFGQHAAVMCGLRYSKGEFVITMDEDLQNLPEDVPKLIETIREDGECDAVFAIPARKKHALYRNIASRIFNLLANHIMKKDQTVKMSSFRILRRRLVNNLLRLKTAEPAIGTMLFIITRRVKNVTVRHEKRQYGRSGYNLAKMFRVTYNSIFNYSALPLQVVSQMGLVFAFSSLALTVYFLIRSREVTVSGWVSTVVLVTFFSGIILFTLGIIGEYLVRIIKAVNEYPPYLVAYSEGVEDDEEK